MSIEVRVPKEIKEYKEKIIFGLSIRQLICVLICGVICLTTFFVIKPLVGVDTASDIVIIEAIPIFAFGFIKIRSLDFEEFIKIFMKHLLGTNKRFYENRIPVNEEWKVTQESLKKDVIKSANIKFTGEVEESRRSSRASKIRATRERIKRAKEEFAKETKRAETKELTESKKQFDLAKEQYQNARKRKNSNDKERAC